MKNYKHLIAGAMAAVMVLGSSVVALADSGSTTGQGSLDIVQESDVFKVVLPTNVDGVFNYILDPTGVIAATNAEKYAGATFEPNQTLYFNVSGGDYAHESDTLTATNKSTMDVEISVKASVTAVEGVTMATSAATVSDGDAQLYLGLVDDVDHTTGLAITTDGVEATATIEAVDGAYNIVYDAESGTYKKQLDESTPFNTYNFHLEGACSATGWEGLSENPPAVEVVWTIENPTGPTDGGAARGAWENGNLWISKDESTGFSTSDLKVEVSYDGVDYKVMATNLYRLNDANWVNTTWAEIVAALGGSDPTTLYIRVTDGNTYYVFKSTAS